MSNALGTLFGEIASAIREKTGDTATMKPAEFPTKISAIESGGGGSGGEIIEGVDPYYQKLAEAVITRNATYLSGDKTTLNMKSFKTSSGGTLGTVASHAFAGFNDVENIIISDTMFVYPNAFADNPKLKIIDVTAPSIGTVAFFGNSLSGCTALESVIVRDCGEVLKNVNFLTIDTAGNNLGGVGANSTFYVYVPEAYYDTIVENVNSLTNAAVSSSRYRKLEDYPDINHWDATYTVNFYDGGKLVDTKSVGYKESCGSSYESDSESYTVVGWNPEPVNITKDMDCYAVVNNSAIVASGECGANAKWRLLSDGVIVISGSGAMPDFANASALPWNAYMADITEVVIREGITSVGHRSFLNCTTVTSVSLPIGITSIGVNAFYGCTSLASINIPNGVTSIGYAAFYKCAQLTSVVIPESVTSIGDYVLNSCSSLKSVDIRGCVTSISAYAFVGCTSLTSITIPNSVKSFGDYAFKECKSLASITIPESVKTIGIYAFYGCTALASVVFDGGTTWWYRTTSSAYTGGTNFDLSSSNGVTNLKSTYTAYYWYRK